MGITVPVKKNLSEGEVRDLEDDEVLSAESVDPEQKVLYDELEEAVERAGITPAADVSEIAYEEEPEEEPEEDLPNFDLPIETLVSVPRTTTQVINVSVAALVGMCLGS